MASLSDLVADVITLTNRPDLTAETNAAIRAATIKAHHTDFYQKDLFETAIQFPTSDYQQLFTYKQLIPNFRAVSYLRKYDSVALAPGKFLTLITPENVLDSYAINREDVFYLSGVQLNIRSADQQQYYLFGCYLNPTVTTTGYSSWIADEHPFAIVFEATRVVFKMIGFDEQASAMDKAVQEEYALLKMQIATGGM
jgi:hypothetical protein